MAGCRWPGRLRPVPGSGPRHRGNDQLDRRTVNDRILLGARHGKRDETSSTDNDCWPAGRWDARGCPACAGLLRLTIVQTPERLLDHRRAIAERFGHLRIHGQGQQEMQKAVCSNRVRDLQWSPREIFEWLAEGKCGAARPGADQGDSYDSRWLERERPPDSSVAVGMERLLTPCRNDRRPGRPPRGEDGPGGSHAGSRH